MRWIGQTTGSSLMGRIVLGLGALALVGCAGSENDDVTVVAASLPGDGAPSPDGPTQNDGPSAGSSERAPTTFPMSRVLFSDQGQTTYVNVLSSLEAADDLDRSREFAGWADLWVHAGKLFVADGEAPVMTRHAVDAEGGFIEEGRLSFQNYGATSVAFWNQLFVADDKAYLFNAEAREVVVWNPSTLATVGSFRLPDLPDRGAQRLAGPSADRAGVVRGNRAYVAFYWASWDDYALSDDSVILVLDTQTNAVLRTIPVACPELNFASVDASGAIYFSNWGFSAVPTLLDGKPKACAVRILAGSEDVDPAWSLTFADLTGGREASALRSPTAPTGSSGWWTSNAAAPRRSTRSAGTRPGSTARASRGRRICSCPPPTTPPRQPISSRATAAPSCAGRRQAGRRGCSSSRAECPRGPVQSDRGRV
jgi:hypothetical protein